MISHKNNWQYPTSFVASIATIDYLLTQINLTKQIQQKDTLNLIKQYRLIV